MMNQQLKFIKIFKGVLKIKNVKVNKLYPIPGFKDYYIVKNKNKVFSFKRKKYLKILSDKHGYLYVLLSKNKKRKQMYIHRLQWITFINAEITEGFEIDHIDSDKRNNKLKNLQLLSKRENISKAHKDGRHQYGELSSNSTFSNEEIHKICFLMSKGYKPKKIIKELNIKNTEKIRYEKVINSIQSGRSWGIISNNYDLTKYQIQKRKVLDICTVKLICKMIELGERNKDIIQKLEVNYDTVSNIRNHKQWKHISENYNF